MADYTALIEARPFCAFDTEPMESLREAGVRTIDLRGSGIEDEAFGIFGLLLMIEDSLKLTSRLARG